MRILKKFIKKLYHLIWFLSIFFLFSPNVFADNDNLYFSDAKFYSGNDVKSTYFGATQYGTQNAYYVGSSSGETFPTSNVVSLKLSGAYIGTSYLNLNNYDYLYFTAGTYGGFGILSSAWLANASGAICLPYSTYQPDGENNPNSSFTIQTMTVFKCDLRGITRDVATTDIIFSISMTNNTSNTQYAPYFRIYINRYWYLVTEQDNQQIISTITEEAQKTQDKIDEIDDTLNDSTVDGSDTTINNLKTQIPTNSVISDLLLLPVRFLQNFVNALNSSCSSFSLGSLLGTNLFMPCINLQNYLGSTIWTMIDLIFSGMFVYGLRKKFIQIYENITNLKNGGNEVD